jgi:hypothetical protein
MHIDLLSQHAYRKWQWTWLALWHYIGDEPSARLASRGGVRSQLAGQSSSRSGHKFPVPTQKNPLAVHASLVTVSRFKAPLVVLA